MSRLMHLVIHFVATNSCKVLTADDDTFALRLLLQYSVWLERVGRERGWMLLGR
jgi:hypothetical protein